MGREVSHRKKKTQKPIHYVIKEVTTIDNWANWSTTRESGMTVQCTLQSYSNQGQENQHIHFPNLCFSMDECCCMELY